MIDFRYHLVSIVAIFLALAIGIVLGSTALKAPVIQTVDQVADQLRSTNVDLREKVGSLQQQVDADQQLVSQLSPAVVDGELSEERVVVVEAPGANGDLRARVVKTLERADASITGRITVQSKFLKEGESSVLDQLAGELKPSGLQLPEGSPYRRAAAVLASALLQEGGQEEKSGNESAAVLSGLKTGGYIAPHGDPGGDATLAVIIPPAKPYKGEQAAANNRVLVDLAVALNEHGGGALVAGPTAAAKQGGMIHALRGSSAAAKAMSSVDLASSATGRVATVFALQREAQGDSGHYGTGQRATATLPAIPAESGESSETSSSSQSQGASQGDGK